MLKSRNLPFAYYLLPIPLVLLKWPLLEPKMFIVLWCFSLADGHAAKRVKTVSVSQIWVIDRARATLFRYDLLCSPCGQLRMITK